MTDFPAYYSANYCPDLIDSDDNYGKTITIVLIRLLSAEATIIRSQILFKTLLAAHI